jgi:hypothetical protein
MENLEAVATEGIRKLWPWALAALVLMAICGAAIVLLLKP